MKTKKEQIMPQITGCGETSEVLDALKSIKKDLDYLYIHGHEISINHCELIQNIIKEVNRAINIELQYIDNGNQKHGFPEPFDQFQERNNK